MREPLSASSPNDAVNVVSYSLYGTGEKYLHGSLMNAHQMPYAYPGWAMVVYHDDSVPASHLKHLSDLGVNLIAMPRSIGRSGSFWRFHAGEDPRFTGGRAVCRDIDSMFTPRELASVAEWKRVGTTFHVMRNSIEPYSSLKGGPRPMHAGMFGMIGGSLPGLLEAITKWPNKQDYFEDEYFQRDWMWPRMQRDLIEHNTGTVFPYPVTNPHGWRTCEYAGEFSLTMPRIEMLSGVMTDLDRWIIAQREFSYTVDGTALRILTFHPNGRITGAGSGVACSWEKTWRVKDTEQDRIYINGGQGEEPLVRQEDGSFCGVWHNAKNRAMTLRPRSY